MSDAGGKFGIVAKEDPVLSKIVPQARRAVQLDKTIGRGAQVLFDYITDCSLWPGVNMRPGVVRFSDGDLAKKFNVSTRTIQNWKAKLKARGHVWTTDKWLKNSWPMTVYNVSAICGQQPLPMNIDTEDGSLSEDETVQLSNRRRINPTGRDRKTGQWLKPGESPKPDAPVEIFVVDRDENKNLRATAEDNFVPPPKDSSSHHGNSLRAPHEEIFVPGANGQTAIAGNNFRARHEETFPGGTKEPAHYGEVRDVSLEHSKVPFKRSTGVNASNGGPTRKVSAENLFLLDVGAMMETWKKGSSKVELSGSGAWWRTSYRKTPALMQRVLAEVRSMVKEGTIKDNPGAAAVDLWKRWKSDKNLPTATTPSATTKGRTHEPIHQGKTRPQVQNARV